MIRYDWPLPDNGGGWLLLLLIVALVCIIGMNRQVNR